MAGPYEYNPNFNSGWWSDKTLPEQMQLKEEENGRLRRSNAIAKARKSNPAFSGLTDEEVLQRMQSMSKLGITNEPRHPTPILSASPVKISNMSDKEKAIKDAQLAAIRLKTDPNLSTADISDLVRQINNNPYLTEYLAFTDIYNRYGAPPGYLQKSPYQLALNPDQAQAEINYMMSDLPLGTSSLMAGAIIPGAGVTNAVINGFKNGTNLVSKIGQSALQGGKALLQASKNPRTLTALSLNVPFVADAALRANSSDYNSSEGISPFWMPLIGLGTLGGVQMLRNVGRNQKWISSLFKLKPANELMYTGTYNPFKLEWPHQWSKRAQKKLTPSKREMILEWNDAVKNSKTKEFKDKYNLFTETKTKKGKSTKTYLEDKDVVNQINNNQVSLPVNENYITVPPTTMQKAAAWNRNLLKSGLWGSLLYGIYDGVTSPSSTTNIPDDKNVEDNSSDTSTDSITSVAPQVLQRDKQKTDSTWGVTNDYYSDFR